MIYLNNGGGGSSGTVIGTGTATRIAFWAASSTLSSDANLFWDNTAKQVIIGATAGAGSMVTNGQYSSAKFVCTTTLDWKNGNVQYIQLANGAQVFTFANPMDGGRYLLMLKQPASGAAGTVTFPGTVLFSGATPPTLTLTNSKVDIVTFVYDGTNSVYYSAYTLNY